MDSSVLLWIVLAVLLIACLVLTVLWMSRQNREIVNSYRSMLEQQSQNETQRTNLILTSNRQLLDKALGLVATNDPLAFQAIQAMTSPTGYDEPQYDPSDEAELARLREMHRDLGDDLNGDELDLLSDVANVAPELFGPNTTAE